MFIRFVHLDVFDCVHDEKSLPTLPSIDLVRAVDFRQPIFRFGRYKTAMLNNSWTFRNFVPSNPLF